MKKFFLFIFIFIVPIVFLFSENTYNFYNYFKIFETKKFCFIYNNEDILKSYKTLNLLQKQYNSLSNGNKQFVYFCNDLPCVKLKPKYMQVEISSAEIDVFSVISDYNADIIKIEHCNDLKIYYCFTKNLADFVILNNQKVNLQFVVNLHTITIGYPMIYGAF